MKKTGFTLIELLVVLAIIGLLATILIPAVNSGIAKARRNACRDNLRQLGVAALSYAGDAKHRGRLPSVGDGGDFASYSAMIKGWHEGGYLDTFGVLVCPLDNGRSVCPPGSADSFNTGSHCSYVYFEGYNLVKVEDRRAQLPLFCDRARGGGTATLGETDNHGADCRNVVYLNGNAQSLLTAAEANAVVKTELPSGVSLVE